MSEEKNPVAILGFVDQKKVREHAYALYGKGFDFWGFNNPSPVYSSIRFDRWYELHSFAKVEADEDEYWHLARLGCPVYMHGHRAEVPLSEAYPKQAMLDYFKVPYFTNSVSWILAHAIYEKRPAIHLFGVDMGTIMNPGPEEFGEQRPSVEFFVGWAMGAGIEVVIPSESDLLKTNVLYGFEEHLDSGYMKTRVRANQMREYARKAHERAAFYDGAASAFASSARTYDLTEEELLDKVAQVADEVE